jgi:hypothetical protein
MNDTYSTYSRESAVPNISPSAANNRKPAANRRGAPPQNEHPIPSKQGNERFNQLKSNNVGSIL